MKTDMRWSVKYQSGFGTDTSVSKTLLELILNHTSECMYYGVRKTWQEGKYTVSKYHTGETVKRYIRIFSESLIKKPDTIIKHRSIINEFIEVVSQHVSKMMHLFDFPVYTHENDIAKRGLLIKNNRKNNVFRCEKRDPFKHTIMKIPR